MFSAANTMQCTTKRNLIDLPSVELIFIGRTNVFTNYTFIKKILSSASDSDSKFYGFGKNFHFVIFACFAIIATRISHTNEIKHEIHPRQKVDNVKDNTKQNGGEV